MEEELEDPKFDKVNQMVYAEDGMPVMRNDLKAGKFDIRVKVGPSYTTRRQEAADSMMQFAQAAPKTFDISGDLIAKAMDWPDADKIAERIRRTIPPQILGDEAEQPDPQAQQQAAMQEQIAKIITELEIQGKRLDNAKTEAETRDKQASATEREVKAFAEAMQAGINYAQFQQAPREVSSSRPAPRGTAETSSYQREEKALPFLS